MDAVPTTRLAPSPTGGLHLGNARTFVANWALARQRGGKVLMRIEDVAPTSTTTTWQDDVLGILQWLGLDWDGPALIQSAELPHTKLLWTNWPPKAGLSLRKTGRICCWSPHPRR